VNFTVRALCYSDAMNRFARIGLVWLCLAGAASAQTQMQPQTQTRPPLGEQAKKAIGSWEFSNADRDKVCTVTLKGDNAPGGYEIEFDKSCAGLFPLVNDIVAWKFPDNDLLYLLDASGKALVEFSEVEDGIFEAPTPGVGVLFLQNAAAAAPAAKPPEQVAGTWALMRSNGKILCTLNLAMSPAQDGMAIAVMPGCDAAIARANLGVWKIDRDELMLVPERGTPWRFEEVDGKTWRRLTDGADPLTMVRQ